MFLHHFQRLLYLGQGHRPVGAVFNQDATKDNAFVDSTLLESRPQGIGTSISGLFKDTEVVLSVPAEVVVERIRLLDERVASTGVEDLKGAKIMLGFRLNLQHELWNSSTYFASKSNFSPKL